jgi:cytochrome c553
MNENTKGWSDEDLQSMSIALSKLPPPRPLAEKGDPQRLARGSALAEKNHCNICHRSDFTGQENVPRLADQREDYLLKTLREYKTGARHAYDATMAEEASRAGSRLMRASLCFLRLRCCPQMHCPLCAPYMPSTKPQLCGDLSRSTTLIADTDSLRQSPQSQMWRTSEA